MLPDAFLIDDREVELGSPGSFWFLVLPAELAGEQSAGEWAPNKQSNLFRFKQRAKLALEITARD
jgi:hypothetical protein